MNTETSVAEPPAAENISGFPNEKAGWVPGTRSLTYRNETLFCYGRKFCEVEIISI